jgi:hypothetical protein
MPRKTSRNKPPPAKAEPIIPDELLRRDQPQPTSPGAMPRPDEGRQTDGSPLLDGGVDQHPIHDEDQEDQGSEDYEQQIEEVARVREGRRE